MTTTPPTLLEAAEALDQWLAPARGSWTAGEVVHLAIAPGDGTNYRMTFVPASPLAFTTCYEVGGQRLRETPPVDASERLLVVHGPNAAVIPVGERSEPWPDYAAEKLDTGNHYTLAAIGLTWWLMAGNPPEMAAVAYRQLVDGSIPGKPNPLVDWDLSRFAVGAVA